MDKYVSIHVLTIIFAGIAKFSQIEREKVHFFVIFLVFLRVWKIATSKKWHFRRLTLCTHRFLSKYSETTILTGNNNTYWGYRVAKALVRATARALQSAKLAKKLENWLFFGNLWGRRAQLIRPVRAKSLRVHNPLT